MSKFTQILCSSGTSYTEDNIKCSFDENIVRKQHALYECKIEETWEEKKKENCCLFDKKKFRFIRAMVKGHLLILKLGLTTYKEFIGTNCAAYGKQLLDLGMYDTKTTDSETGHEYLANALGIGALIETVDSKFIFVKRSEKCAESAELVDRVGGHPEPDEVQYSGLNILNKIKDGDITQEIFTSVKREIEDELNIPKKCLGPLYLLGVSFNEDLCYKPSLEFYVRCDMTSQEVSEKYAEQTQPEKYESTEIYFVERYNLIKMADGKLTEIPGEFTNALKSALYLFSIYSS